MWTPSALRADGETPAPYSEPGLGLAGATPQGAPSSSGSVGSTTSLDILITLAFSNASRLSSLLGALSDPASPGYHHYLSAAEVASEFGAPAAVYSALVGYLASFGVTDLTTFEDRLTVSFAATPSQASQIFHTSLGAYVTSSGEPFYAPASAPELPAPLAPYVEDVEGLSNYSHYLLHLAPLSTAIASPTLLEPQTATSPASAVHVPAAVRPAVSLTSPGASGNPFANTTVSSNGFVATYDRPVERNLSDESGTCDTNFCGDFVEAPDLQVTYNETGLFEKYGYPANATVATILWSDPVCTSDTGTCSSSGLYNHFCSTLTTGDSAWDFFMPDVTSFWNYSLPAGEPMPEAYSLPETGYTYAYPTGSQGYSASCDDGGAEAESTLDVDMLGSLTPGANVFQVFGGANTLAAVDTAFADILNPTTSDFSSTGGFDTSAAIAELENVSVITNSWTSSGALPAAWTSDLEIAEARGITVLGATGDSGTTLAPPAEIADNTYGVVAVGGTTAAINQTTLLRGPPHLAVSSAPYYGVGTGEIGWYEPAGTVYGFTGTYGGTGGVGTTASYYRATWFNASADASSVTDLVSSGNYRAEPDVAAIANDTLIDLDQGPYSLNFTCWVSHSCSAVSPKAVGLTSGSSPTVGGTYLIGTSIATPVTGGLVATIDFALYARHEGRLGYPDPAVYPMGQKQSSGQLTLASFYDVTEYTDAGGLSVDYEARAGYSLATGWGVIDAGNYTQNTLTYNMTFAESGLPSGTSWSVTVAPTIGDANCTVSGSSCSNRATETSSGTTVVVAEAYGLYTYTVTSSNGEYSASGGSFEAVGRPVSMSVLFSRMTYPVTFTETGLPSGSAWFVNLTGGGSHGGAAGSATIFPEPNGTYDYGLGSVNLTWAGSAGSFVVAGAAVSVAVVFHEVTYGVTYTETGLPPGLSWTVSFGGTLESLTTDGGADSLVFGNEPNGTYSYAIMDVPGWHQITVPYSGRETVAGSGLSVHVAYDQVTYLVTFSETGLPTGTDWFLNLSGGASVMEVAGVSIEFSEPNGTYVYGLGSSNRSWASPAGSFTVAAGAVQEVADFTIVDYELTFTETGLSSNVGWSLTVAGTTLTSTGAAIALEESNGTYTYAVSSALGYSPSPRTGSVIVDGTPVRVSVVFAVDIPALPALYEVYSSRPDLRTAYPDALNNSSELARLVSWAGRVVTDQILPPDSSQAKLLPFGYYYDLMGVYNARSDLRAAYPSAYSNQTNYTRLVSWAGRVVTGAITPPDSSEATLQPFGYYYDLMQVYNSRPDLQAAYPGAYVNGTSGTELEMWAGRAVAGIIRGDSSNATLQPFGYYYDLFFVYNSRPDLRAAFPDAYLNASNYTRLVSWAGRVVTGAISPADSSNATLQPFGWYYDLLNVYNNRPDLQSAFPNAYLTAAGYSELLAWAKGVVERLWTDSAYPALLPYAPMYEALG